MNRISPDRLGSLLNIARVLDDKVRLIETFTLHLNPAPGYPTHKETVLHYMDEAKDLSGRLVRGLEEIGKPDPPRRQILCEGPFAYESCDEVADYYRCRGCGGRASSPMGMPAPLTHVRTLPEPARGLAGADAAVAPVKDAPRGVPTA